MVDESGDHATVANPAFVSSLRPAPRRYKAVARRVAYHGTTFGALSINGIAAIRAPFEPLVPEVRHVANTNRYHRPSDETEEQFTAYLLDDLEQTILAMGPETVCLVHMEPVQNAGGAFTPPEGYWKGVREMQPESGGVRVSFHEGIDPVLYETGGSKAACLLYKPD